MPETQSFTCLCGQHITLCGHEEAPIICLTCGQQILSVATGTNGERTIQRIQYPDTWRYVETYTEGDITLQFICEPDTGQRFEALYQMVKWQLEKEGVKLEDKQ